MFNYFTDNPFVELGDTPHQPAPIPKVEFVKFDGDKWCKVKIEGKIGNVKYFYLYKTENDLMNRNHVTFDEICCVSYDKTYT